MLHFLVQNNKKHVIREYLLRISIFALIIVSAVSCLLIALFLPSFFFAEYKSNTIANQAQSVNLSNISTYENSSSLIKSINEMSNILSYDTTRTLTTNVINTIISLKNKNITISSVSVSLGNTDRIRNISVSGISASRGDLTSFYDNVKGEGTFQNVVLPISSLINDAGAPFTITLTYVSN